MSMKIAGQENKKLFKKNNEKQAKLLQPPGEKKPTAEKGLNKKLRWRDK